MSNIKLIALDMDGTACVFQKGVVEGNIQPIISAQEKGVKVIFATGRPVIISLPEAYKVKMDQYNEYFIGFNGACIYDIANQKIVHTQTINNEHLQLLFKLADKYHVDLWCYTDNLDEVIVNFDALGTHNLECNFFTGKYYQYWELPKITHESYKCLAMNVKETDQFVKEVRSHGIEVAIDAAGTAEINAPGISKYVALEWVAKKLGIDNSEIMAIGDSMNDYTMIKNVGLGIAMGDAQQPLKDVAKDITDIAANAGVAKMINKYVLNS
ncbi:Cof-type HAD-IIB family hydrolase [Spiroplasma sp. DGKH1]|uniref:Cof-type HAD-IIB family hydrolase n=1 Tax=Spiroplasma sp. DGKH1 TaxID=3050074 RepID=UPI0034C62A7A